MRRGAGVRGDPRAGRRLRGIRARFGRAAVRTISANRCISDGGCRAGRPARRGAVVAAGVSSSMARASAAASPGATTAPLPAGARARISGAPPAAVTIAGVPLASASTAARPYGSGSVDGEREHVEVGVDVGHVGAQAGPVHAERGGPRREARPRTPPCPSPARPRSRRGGRDGRGGRARTRRGRRRSPSTCRGGRPRRRAGRRRGSRRARGSARRGRAGTRHRRPSRGRRGCVGASSWSAMACDMAITSVAKRRVRTCSTRSAARDCTTISRACHTWGRRVIAAAAQPYHECSEFVCTTVASSRRTRPRDPCDRERPARAVRGPVGGAVPGREPPHRDDVQRRARRLVLGARAAARPAPRGGSRTRPMAGCAPFAAAPDPTRRARRPVGWRAAGSCVSPSTSSSCSSRPREASAATPRSWRGYCRAAGRAGRRDHDRAVRRPPSPARRVRAALREFGLDGLEPVVAAAARARSLYDSWHVLGLRRPVRHLGRPLRDVDVVHAPSVAVPPRGDAPLVVTVHDAAPLLFPETYPRRGRWFHELGFAAAAARADLVITVSHAPPPTRSPRTPRSRRDRIRVVPNGVDLARRRRRRGRARARRVRRSTSARTCCGSAASSPARTSACSLDAFAAWAATTGRDHRLVLAGPPGWVEDETADARAVQRRWATASARSAASTRQRCAALYRGADLFAVPQPPRGLRPARARGDGAGDGGGVRRHPRAARGRGRRGAAASPVDDVAAWADAIEELLADDGARGALAAARGSTRRRRSRGSGARRRRRPSTTRPGARIPDTTTRLSPRWGPSSSWVRTSKTSGWTGPGSATTSTSSGRTCGPTSSSRCSPWCSAC